MIRIALSRLHCVLLALLILAIGLPLWLPMKLMGLLNEQLIMARAELRRLERDRRLAGMYRMWRGR